MTVSKNSNDSLYTMQLDQYFFTVIQGPNMIWQES